MMLSPETHLAQLVTKCIHVGIAGREHWLIVKPKNYVQSTSTLPHVNLFFPLPWVTVCFPLQLCHLHACACVTLKFNPCSIASPAREPGNEARCHYYTWCWVQSLTLFNLCLLMLGFRLHWLIVTHKNCYSICTLPHVNLFFPLPWVTVCFPLQLCHLHACTCVTLKFNPCSIAYRSLSYFTRNVCV